MSTQRSPSPTDLLLACCRWPSDAAVVARLARGVDRPRFLALVRRHRVQGLAYRALKGAGVPADDLATDARRIAGDNLRLAVEAVRLHRLLAAAGVPALLIKGVALGMLAYGDLGAKMGWDIDLLIPPDCIAEGAAVLAQAGYRTIVPGPDIALAQWHGFAKDSIWANAAGVHVELHTRLLDSPLLLPGIDACSPARNVALAPGLSVPTLQEDALFAYLCLHGAASGWRRLKWLADVAALLGQGDAIATERLHARADALGAGRAAGQALLLCQLFFALPLTPGLAAKLATDRATRLLAWSAARMMLDERGYDDPGERAWGTLPIHLAHFLLRPGWRYRFAEARRKLRPDPQIGGATLLYPWQVLRRRLATARSAGRA